MTIGTILAAKGRDVVTTQPHRTLAEVAEVLLAKNIGAVVVTNVQGRVIGIFSERDIVRAVAKRGPAVFNHAVSKHMTAEVMTTSEDERVHVAMEKMTNGRFRHLPVIRQEKLVGLVSIGDLVKHNSPSANMNTRRCENISRPPEPRGTMAQRKSNIQAFMGLEFGFCVSAIGLDDAPASGQDRSQAAGGWKTDLGLNTQTQHLRLRP